MEGLIFGILRYINVGHPLFVLFENHPLLLRISLAENITLFDKNYVDTNKIYCRPTSNSYGMSVRTKKKRSCEQEAA